MPQEHPWLAATSWQECKGLDCRNEGVALNGKRGVADLVRLEVEVVVGAFCGQADTVQAVDLHGGRLGQWALEWVVVVLLWGSL